MCEAAGVGATNYGRTMEGSGHPPGPCRRMRSPLVVKENSDAGRVRPAVAPAGQQPTPPSLGFPPHVLGVTLPAQWCCLEDRRDHSCDEFSIMPDT